MDVISRTELLANLEAWRVVEKRHEKFEDNEKMIKALDRIIKVVKEFPDAITRCKDCEYYGKTNDNCSKYSGNDFCSYGEPKHEDPEEPDYEAGYDIEMGFDPFLGCYTDDC